MESLLALIHNWPPLRLALSAGIFAWLLSALGAALIFATRGFNQKFFDAMLGFAGGVMIAASFWSLLEPALEIGARGSLPRWFPATAGFLLGTFVLRGLDRVVPHLHLGFPGEETEGIKTSWRRSVLLVLAITLHNIPEGIALGVAIGAAVSGYPEASLAGAMVLTLGIGLHNIPEGFTVSAAVRREKLSKRKSFWFGQLSAVTYPVTACLGLVSVLWAQAILPYALGFAAGAMIFVVVEEVIPESQRNKHADLATVATLCGFLGMMILDVTLG